MSAAPRYQDSVFGGVLLILVGVLLLLDRFDTSLHLGHLVRVYWPVLIILWGVAKLIDHLIARSGNGARAPFLTGGEVLILFVVIVILSLMGLHDWVRNRYPDIAIHIEPFTRNYSTSQALAPLAIPPGSHVTIETGRGNITVHTLDVGTLNVAANLHSTAQRESTADDAMKKITVAIDQTRDGYIIHPLNQESSGQQVSVDLDVQTPRNVVVTAVSDVGDITVAGVGGAVSVTARNGNVDVHDTGSDASVDAESGNARVSDIPGNLRLTGHASEIDVGDVAGNATLEGDFYGPVHLRNIAKVTRYVTPRDNFTVMQMTGRLELDSDSVELTDVTGAATLTTHNKDVDAENITGQLVIADTHAGVTVRYPNPPAQNLLVTNESGDVDVTLPSNSKFQIAAVSRGGEVDSDFSGPSLNPVNEAGSGQLNGEFGGGGPKINIATSYGTITLHES